MAGKTTLATLVLVVVAAAALMEGAAATVYFVGDTTGWTIPSSAAFYSTWAANHTFAIGDILVFNFANGAHDVATVTKTAYDSCSSASPITPLQSTPPVNVTLSTSGEHYFICTVGQHCANGQKLSVNVPAAAGSPTPTPSPSPSPTPSPTPSTTPSPTPSTTPSPTPSTTPTHAPTPAPTPSPTAHSPAPSSTPTNSPPPPPSTESPPPSSSPSPTGSTSPPPPPPSSAPRKAVAAFGMVVMSVAVAALF